MNSKNQTIQNRKRGVCRVIISASRRTDIPAFFSKKFFQDMEKGETECINPYSKETKRISLKKEDVDCFVFWTKNPIPMFEDLNKLDGYTYYFQFTLNSYGTDIEPNVPSKGKTMIPAMIDLSKRIGNNRIVWRYDPILITKKYTVEYHIKYFEALASKLQGCFHHCVISFVDVYGKNQANFQKLGMRPPTDDEIDQIAAAFSAVADKYGFNICTCSEKIDLDKYHMTHGKCIDTELIEEISGQKLDLKKDKNQRSNCGCAPSVDIGKYNSCTHNCAYCYANSYK